MPSIFITGANRGLGLEFVKQLLPRGWRIFAACRNSSNELESLEGEIEVFNLDVGDYSQIEALGKEFSNTAIDILLNNAGMYDKQQSIGNIDPKSFEDTFRINSISPLKIVEAFLPSLRLGERKLILNMSSKMGSVADNSNGGSYAYRASKAALNAINMSLANDLKSEGITSIVLHPGWVLTDMGGPNALITPQQSIAGMIAQIENFDLKDSGKFLAYDGKEVPW